MLKRYKITCGFLDDLELNILYKLTINHGPD